VAGPGPAIRQSTCQLALRINFNAVLLQDGLHRFIP
jgi:hypothetical protein